MAEVIRMDKDDEENPMLCAGPLQSDGTGCALWQADKVGGKVWYCTPSWKRRRRARVQAVRRAFKDALALKAVLGNVGVLPL